MDAPPARPAPRIYRELLHRKGVFEQLQQQALEQQHMAHMAQMQAQMQAHMQAQVQAQQPQPSLPSSAAAGAAPTAPLSIFSIPVPRKRAREEAVAGEEQGRGVGSSSSSSSSAMAGPATAPAPAALSDMAVESEPPPSAYAPPPKLPTFGLLCDLIRSKGAAPGAIVSLLGQPPPPPPNALHAPPSIPWINDSTEEGGQPSTPLCLAAKQGHVAIVQLLCERYGAWPNAAAQRSGYTPLGMAVHGGHAACAEYLLARGADPCLKNKWGESALSAAQRASRGGGGEGRGGGCLLLLQAPCWSPCSRQRRGCMGAAAAALCAACHLAPLPVLSM